MEGKVCFSKFSLLVVGVFPSGVRKPPFKGIYDSGILLEGSAFRHITAVQRKPLPALDDSQMPSVQNNS